MGVRSTHHTQREGSLILEEGLRRVPVPLVVKASLCSGRISDTEMAPESQRPLAHSPRGLLTQGLCPIHSLDVHEAWQVGPHQDDVAASPLVGTVDATGLPVSPVDIGAEQGEAIRELDR